MKTAYRALRCIVLFACFCLSGCSTQRHLREIDCSECKGKGVVVYSENHPLVVNGLVNAGTSDTCWACSGQGKLFEEVEEINEP